MDLRDEADLCPEQKWLRVVGSMMHCAPLAVLAACVSMGEKARCTSGC